jgi:hypothetical protein
MPKYPWLYGFDVPRCYITRSLANFQAANRPDMRRQNDVYVTAMVGRSLARLC